MPPQRPQRLTHRLPVHDLVQLVQQQPVIVLGDSYGIARTTAHKALRVLVDEGLAVVSRGRGIYVKR